MWLDELDSFSRAQPGLYAPLAIAISAILADCYEATRPISGLLHASGSMRASAVVGVLFLALDEGAQHTSLNTDYRWSRMRIVFAASYLIYVAILSTRTATAATRAWEGTFIFVVMSLCLLVPRFYSEATLSMWGKIQRLTNPTYTSTFAVLAYAGTRIAGSGLFMCRDTLEQMLHPEFGFESSELLPGDVCVACNGWGAACVTMSGTVLFLTSLCCLFILNNPNRCEQGLPEYVVTYGELNQSLRLAVSLYSATLVCSYLAVADCVTNTDQIYEHSDCTIGYPLHTLANSIDSTSYDPSSLDNKQQPSPTEMWSLTALPETTFPELTLAPPPPSSNPLRSKDCSQQLVEFRRLGLVQHSLGCNTLSFIALIFISLRIEQDYMRLRQSRKLLNTHIVYPGMLVASITIAVTIALRINISEWNTDGFVELSFFTVLAGIVLGSFAKGGLVASFLVYFGLFIEYVYYCETEGGCRNFRYLTNASNANMGVLYILALSLETVYYFELFDESIQHALKHVLAWITRIGLSISAMLALLVTAALAAYDGSNVDEVVVRLDPIVNAGLGEQQTILRFLLWHYAPLIAWAFFTRTLNEIGVFADERLDRRLLLWLLGGGLAGGSWFLYGVFFPNNSETPAAYPMSQMFMMVFTVVPAWILVAW